MDANNLYGWAMSQYLPYSKFEWLIHKDIDKFDANLMAENSLDGYILDVDHKYPDELHELHNDYSLVPETLEISHDMLSKYCSNIADIYDIKIRGANYFQT